MAKLIDITGKAISGEWGTDDEAGIGIPVLRTTNFTNEGVVNYNNVVTRTITKRNITDKFLRDGDIIIEKSGGSDRQPVGRVIYYDGPDNTYLFNNFTGLLRVQNKKIWNPRYVFYALFGNYRQGGTRAFENKTTGLHNLKIDDYINKFEIKESSLQNQESVCAVLDKIQHVIALYKQQLTNLDILIKSRFVEMFGDIITNPMRWDKAPLGTVCDVRDGTHDSPQYCETGYPLVTSKNVTSGKIDLTDCSLISKADFDRINVRSKVDYGDIIMPMIGTVGKPIIVDINTGFAIKNVALIKFYKDTKVNNIYVKNLLESDYFDNAVISRIRGGTQKFIALGDIRGLNILLPDMKVQNKFAAFVRKTDKLKSIRQKSLEKTQLLFDSLMQKYFG